MDATSFKPVSLTEKDEYYARWLETPQRSIDYTLANLWGWQLFYGLEWSFDGGLIWIRQNSPNPVLWAPVGNWNAFDWQKALPDLSGKAFSRVPEALLSIWKERLSDQISWEDERGQWEYLYLQKELADLSGNRFHKKKNHLNSYIKSYGAPDYRKVDAGMIPAVLAVQDDWCQWHECEDSPSLQAENTAIQRVLTHWAAFRDLEAGSLYLDGKMIAFSVGERLDAENLGVQYEKCLNGFKGVYQAMNREFVIHAGQGFKYINRAQDLGETGLRQAKETYMPVGFLKKYRVVFK